MLFLAVFCGFLAEYQLEHKIEKDREKQYIISFEEDLDNDILDFDGQISLCQVCKCGRLSHLIARTFTKRKIFREYLLFFSFYSSQSSFYSK